MVYFIQYQYFLFKECVVFILYSINIRKCVVSNCWGDLELPGGVEENMNIVYMVSWPEFEPGKFWIQVLIACLYKNVLFYV